MSDDTATLTTVIYKCPDCIGTGVYVGYKEEKGVGVKCCACRGTGCRSLKIRLFTGRERRHNIETIRLEDGREISYEEFLKMKIPMVS